MLDWIGLDWRGVGKGGRGMHCFAAAKGRLHPRRKGCGEGWSNGQGQRVLRFLVGQVDRGCSNILIAEQRSATWGIGGGGGEQALGKF